MGRGIYRSYYKGHKSKSRGRVEVREGSEIGWDGWRDGEKRHTSVIL